MMKAKVGQDFLSCLWKNTRIYLLEKNRKVNPSSYVINYFHTGRYVKCNTKSSELHVSGDRAQSVFKVLSPYLDIPKTFVNISDLEHNLKLRGISLDVRQKVQLWDKLQYLLSYKRNLEEERIAIAKTVNALAKQKFVGEKENLSTLKTKGKELREKLKVVTKEVNEVEDDLILSVLMFPNKLHHSVCNEDKVLMKFFGKPVFQYQAKGHEVLGKLNEELEFVDSSPTAYYLKNRLALLELACNEYFTSVFQTHGYLLHSNPDFVKGVVVEGSGIHVSEIEKVFMLSRHKSDSNGNSQYLVGGSTLQAFASYFTKQIIDNPKCIPQKLVTIGRSYLPTHNKYSGLFKSWQSTAVDSFVVFEDNLDVQEQMLNEVLMALVQCYTQLKIHFQVKQYAPHNLETHEMAAFGVLMFSPSTKTYLEVGRISVCGDYISKRLLALRKVTGNSAKFLSMIHIRVCNITHLLAFIIENGQNESGSYDIPQCLRKLMYI